MEFERLVRLEDIVGRLLTQYAELKTQNEILAAAVTDKKQELDRLHAKIQEMQGNKEEVHHRVSSILTKLEEWERANEDVGADDGRPPKAQAAPVAQDSQKKLFNMGV